MTRVLPSVIRRDITENIKNKWNISPIIVVIFQTAEYIVQYIRKKEYISLDSWIEFRDIFYL